MKLYSQSYVKDNILVSLATFIVKHNLYCNEVLMKLTVAQQINSLFITENVRLMDRTQ